MKCGLTAVGFYGLRVQVLLWTLLPLVILLIVFSLTGISRHEASMHALAAEENTRLVRALAGAISAQVDSYILRSPVEPEEVPVSALHLDRLLEIEHPNTEIAIALVDQQGKMLFGRGALPPAEETANWPGVSQALSGESGAVFEPETGEGDIIAYAPVPNTGWALAIREPWHSLTAPLIRFEQAMPFILLAAMVTSFLTLFFGLRYVVGPLRELGLRASRIGQGEFEAAGTPVGGVKEIEDLRLTIHQMVRRIQSYQAALQDYLRAVTQAQEEERARLARELHDETVQTLIALDHKAQMVQRALERDPGRIPERLAELRRMISEATEAVRRFSRALRPLYLEELGLIPALEMMAQEAGATFRVTGPPVRLKPEKELVLYRIAQEALTNARRHAQTQNIRAELEFEPTRVTLRVQDDGVGFHMPPGFAELTHGGHFGLMGMHERARLAGGQLAIQTFPAKGTTITLSLPI